MDVPDEARDAREAREVSLVTVEAPAEEAAGLEEEAAGEPGVAEVRVQRGERAEARAHQHRRAVVGACSRIAGIRSAASAFA